VEYRAGEAATGRVEHGRFYPSDKKPEGKITMNSRALVQDCNPGTSQLGEPKSTKMW
jgi:hypothetical protein